jgi:ferredoxin-NADP reductase
MPQKLPCEVTGILDHGEGVYSLFLRPETPAPRFLPGQFLHLALDSYTPGDFWPDSRTLSIASAPSERSLLRITYAVKGEFTRRMERELYNGSRVWIKLPYGEFIVPADRQVCLLAGGTGVTAFTAFLGGLAPDHPHPVHLFYGARRPGLLIYRSLVEQASRCCLALHAHFLAEQDAQKDGCLPGRITLETVFSHLSNPQAVTFYIAGPPAMLSALTEELQGAGIPAEKVVIDAWE